MYNLFKYLEEVEGKSIPFEIRIKYNIKLYYKDKSLIEDDEILNILDKAYNFLKDLLTDDLNKLKQFEPKYKALYDVVYGKSKHRLLVAYDKKRDRNDIHYSNVYLKFYSYMEDYTTDYKILIAIIHEYLVNTLQMNGSRTLWL